MRKNQGKLPLPLHAGTRREFVGSAVVAGAIALVPAAARGQERFPARNIRIIVPFPAGATTDMLARLFAQRMTESLGQSVVVENVGGAGGSLGADQVAKAAPDGYTLLFHNITFTTTTSSLQYVGRSKHDIEQDFVPISVGAYVPFWLLAHPSVPARTVAELVALAKAQPGKLNYASPGNATPHHLAMELLKLHFGIQLVHVPYKGTAGAVTDLLSGQIQLMFLPVHVALSQVRAGKLAMLASGGAQRSPVTPEVPSLADAGMRDIDADIWYALLGPADLPREVVALLNSELAAILLDPETRGALLKQGLTPRTGTPADLAKLIEADLVRWARLVREARITVD
jgi:tripartite-type tricarboxylate transporter receptor subunit TctC